MNDIKSVQDRKRIAVKEALAKLMATENIIVEHAPIPTAAFDLVNRKLLIPLWKDISEDVYTLLISHEVGHALYTPQAEWMKAVKETENKNYKQVVNIVEDVRIEKMIQSKYPGTVRSFKAGYDELEKQDLFGTQTSKKEIKDYGILDRINLHYKLGHYGYVNVPFAEEEKSWLSEIDNAKTFPQVLEISKRLLKYAEEEAEKKGESLEEQETTQGDITINADSKELADAIEKQLKEQNPSDGSGQGQKVTITHPDPSAPKSGDQQSADGKEKSEENSKSEKSGTGNEQGKPNPIVISVTQDNFDKKLAQYVDLTSQVDTINIPEFDLNKIIIDYKVVLKQLREYYNRNDIYSAKAQEYLSQFKANNKHVVNQLVNLFEMKKKASSDARVLISKTGILDTNKVHGYRYNEDIFRKVTNTPNGKNHGLVVFIDMSGSMVPHMAGTYAQMINIAMFCRKVNIPFDVYGFTDVGASRGQSYSYNYDPIGPIGTKKTGNVFLNGSFSLRNYLSSRMTLHEYNDMLECLMCVMSHYVKRKDDYPYFGLPNCESLGGTPLNEAIISAMQIVPKLKAKHNLDIIHTVVITDGDGTSGINYFNNDSNGKLSEVCANRANRDTKKIYCRYKNSSRTWDLTNVKNRSNGSRARDFTANLIEMYKDITGAKMIGFFVCDKNSAKYQIASMNYGETQETIERAKNQFDDKQFAEVKKDGYDSYYIIPAGQDLLTSSEDIEFSDTTAKSAIHNQFVKALSKKKNSRILLGRFIDHIA